LPWAGGCEPDGLHAGNCRLGVPPFARGPGTNAHGLRPAEWPPRRVNHSIALFHANRGEPGFNLSLRKAARRAVDDRQSW